MGKNPYRLADRRQRHARHRVEGPFARLAGLSPLVGAIAAVWLARDLYGTLLAGGEAAWAAGFTGVTARVGLVVAALLSLTTYDTLVRGPDRGVIDIHPLLPRPWLLARMEGLVRDRLPWLAVAAVFLLPVLPRTDAFALGAAVLLGAWCAGLGVGLGVNLAAPALATRPSLAGLFDAIRGPNPRLQAALLYAPGVALALSGTATVAAAWGAGRVLLGDPAGFVGLASPFVLAVAGVVLAVRSAPAMSGIGAVLGEIEAAWAESEDPEDARSVYLEWTVRLAPAPLRVALRKELRHLWRAHRAWVTGSWGLAFLAGIAGWTESPDGVARLAQVGAAALAAVGYVGVRLGASDPPWLDTFLPLHGRVVARAAAVFSAMQVVVAVGTATLLVRQGVPALGVLLRLELAALALAAVAAWSGDTLRAKGGLVYVPAALLVWAVGGMA
ncbi:MAG: hypothetical protein Q8P18_07175 [Pseudomonadota bacterium]|nr:hypothetical protein [Pseudomonadota bacterium]